MVDQTQPNMTITESARQYLQELLAKQNEPGMAVRIFVEHPGTPRAECCMAYCAAGEHQADDVRVEYPDFLAFIEGHSVPYLEDAVVDYNKDRMGGQLTFRAPRSKVPNLSEGASIEERINHVLYAEINPGLASHGGNVSLVEVFEDDQHGLTALLRFGGGCQGCSAVDMTLRDGVQATLIERIPELKRVTDTTDHTVRDQAYYK